MEDEEERRYNGVKIANSSLAMESRSPQIPPTKDKESKGKSEKQLNQITAQRNTVAWSIA